MAINPAIFMVIYRALTAPLTPWRHYYAAALAVAWVSSGFAYITQVVLEEMPALLLGAIVGLMACTVLTGHGNPTLKQLRDSPLIHLYNASFGKQSVEYLIIQEAEQYSAAGA